MATLTRFPDAKRRSATLSRGRYGRRHQTVRLALEPLEVRWLPSTTGVQLPPAETINLADNLGTLGVPVQASGSIGGGPQGAADVAWYHFQLGQASQVDLTVRTPTGDAPFASVLSLFNSDPNDVWNPYGSPNAYGDPYDPTGHRLIDQVQANPGTGTAQLVQNLSPGDYYVAISGAGNLDFSPVVAGSGFDGATGSYVLSASATSLGLSNSGPTMIASDPAAGSVLNSSPLAIRVAMSAALDPNTLNLGQDVQLLSLPAGGGPASAVTLAGINFSAAADELQLYPQAPLAPGTYEVLLLGNASGGGTVLAGPSGSDLGQNAQNPQGANESFTFQVDGVDGVAGATASDSTAATAHQLGDITGAGLVRVTGAIGVDPSFNPSLSVDPTFPDPWNNPANQVDLYHFSVVGPGRFMLLADASAGLIGSPLDPGLSLWKLDPSTGQLDFIAGNNNTGNTTQGTDGSVPLFTDSALSAGLTAGDYYIAVANGSNTPSPLEGQPPGTFGLFDPNQPGSAQNGWTTGPYVLDLLVAPAPAAPTVVESSPYPGQTLGSAPTQVTVQFS
ncbi:MAG: DVUA0089 family protein, partial [Isosphaeraceae bacterium]